MALKRSLEFIWVDGNNNDYTRTYSNVNPDITDTEVFKTLALKMSEISHDRLKALHVVNTEDVPLT